jgi:hypothetical protein
MTAFWNDVPYNLDLMMEVVNTFEALVNFCETSSQNTATLILVALRN